MKEVKWFHYQAKPKYQCQSFLIHQRGIYRYLKWWQCRKKWETKACNPPHIFSKIALSLNWSFDRYRHVLALFNASFNKNIELKRCMISSIDCARKSTIDFPVCYATRNLFGTFAVLTKNLNLFNIWESITAAFKWISPGRLRCAITSACLGTCLNKSRCMKDRTPHEAVFQKILLTSLYWFSFSLIQFNLVLV